MVSRGVGIHTFHIQIHNDQFQIQIPMIIQDD